MWRAICPAERKEWRRLRLAFSTGRRSCGPAGRLARSGPSIVTSPRAGWSISWCFPRIFPRSVRFCIEKADISLHRISGTPRGTFSNEAERETGRLLADLNFGSTDDAFAGGLHDYLDSLQERFNRIGGAIFESYVLMPERIQVCPVAESRSPSALALWQMQQQQTAVIETGAPATPAAGMRLAVMHRTTFHYGAPVTHSLNTLHLEPRTFPYQKTLSSSDPGDSRHPLAAFHGPLPEHHPPLRAARSACEAGNREPPPGSQPAAWTISEASRAATLDGIPRSGHPRTHLAISAGKPAGFEIRRKSGGRPSMSPAACHRSMVRPAP